MEIFAINWKDNETRGKASNLENVARQEFKWTIDHVDDAHQLYIAGLEYLSLIHQLHEFGEDRVRVEWLEPDVFLVVKEV